MLNLYLYIRIVNASGNWGVMKLSKRLPIAIFMGIAGMMCLCANGQWVQQTIQLEKGWNAVQLKVQPVPGDCETVFAGQPVEQVQFWAESAGHIAYEVDPDSPLSRQLRWYSWRPSTDNGSVLNGFSQLIAGRSYLIQASSDTTLSITGRAVLTRTVWVPNSWNLVGLPVSEENGCSFFDYFKCTEEIGGYSPGTSYVGQVGTNSAAQSVYNAHQIIKAGEAYWIKANQVTEYDGPVSVSLASGAGYIKYGSLPKPEILRIRNDSSVEREVTVSTNSLGLPPEGEKYAQYMPLTGRPVGIGTYSPFTMCSSNMAPESVWEIELLPNLAGFETGMVWEAILKVSDDQGALEQYVGVTTKDETRVEPMGLWIGSVVIDQVGHFVNKAEQGLESASDPFSFRVILHVDSAGDVSLVQQVLVATVPADDVLTNGLSALLDDRYAVERFLEQYPEAKIVRISTVNLPGMERLFMGSFHSADPIRTTVDLPYAHALNPFKHQYAALHDNKDADGEGDEAFTVNRDISLQFSAVDPYASNNPLWGVTEYGGTYEEVISGLVGDFEETTRNVTVKGTFRIEKINTVGTWTY